MTTTFTTPNSPMSLEIVSERIDQRRLRRYGRTLTVYVSGWDTDSTPVSSFREAFAEQYASLGGSLSVQRVGHTWNGEQLRVELWVPADKPSLIHSMQDILDADDALIPALTGAFSHARDLQLDREERLELSKRATVVAEHLRDEVRSRAKAAIDYDVRMAELKVAYNEAYEAAVEALTVEVTEGPTYDDGTTEDPRVVRAALKVVASNSHYPWSRYPRTRQHIEAKDIV